jgi:hypothetical protein
MTTLTIISIILALSGIALYAYANRELPESISDMVYDIEKPWVWTLWVVLMAFTAMIPMMDAMTEKWRFISFLTMACLLFVAVWPLVMKEKRTSHYVLAIVGAILSQVCVALVSPWWLLTWFAYVPLTASIWQWTTGKGVLFAEMIAMVCVWGSSIIS